MNPFSGKFLSKYSFMLLWVASSERLHSKATLLKTRKASKDQEEILTCALQNGCSKIGKAVGEKTPLNTKTPLNDWLKRVFICLVSQIILASAGQLPKCNRKTTIIAFRILVKPPKPISKLTWKNLLCSSLIVRFESPTSMKENSITSVFLLILLSFSEELR